MNKGTADATAVTGKEEIEMDNEGTTEFYFKPTFIKVKPGQIMTVELKNEGTVPHNFSIESLNVNVSVPQGLRTIWLGSKFGIQRPPVGMSTAVIVAVLPL